MTTTTADADRVRRLLATGKTVQQVADLTTWPRPRVVAVITSTKGWLHDRTKDVAYEPDRPGEPPHLPDEPPAPAPDPTPTPTPKADSKPARLADASVPQLLTGAMDINDKTVQRELRKTADQIARLRRAVATAEARTAAAREVAILERKLAEAKARLKNTSARRTATGKAPTTPAGDGQVRAWAKANDVECNPQGRVPRAVRDQYEAAHGTQK